MRVVRLRRASPGTSAFIVERADRDSQLVPQWSETEDEGDRDEAISEALVAAHDELEELRRRANAREVLPFGAIGGMPTELRVAANAARERHEALTKIAMMVGADPSSPSDIPDAVLRELNRAADKREVREEANAKTLGAIDVEDVKAAVAAESMRCHSELRAALGLREPATWPELIAKVADLAVTDCAPASQAEQMLWQLGKALDLGTNDHTWADMLDEVRTGGDAIEPSDMTDTARLRVLLNVRKALGAADLETTVQAAKRVKALADAAKGDAGVPAFVQCPYRFDASGGQCALLDGHAGLHRTGDYELHDGAPSRPEGEISRGRAVVDAQGLASLRAELTALGKHLEDVERRAYDTTTKAEHDQWRSQNAEWFRRVVENGAKLEDRVERVEETGAGKAETLEAVRSLTDALQALKGRLADAEARIGQPGPLDALENRVERLEGHIEHRAWTAITERVEALEQASAPRALADLLDCRIEGMRQWQVELEGKVAECFDRTDNVVRMIGDARVEEKREAVIRERGQGGAEPIDLATLRVPCASGLDGDLAEFVVDPGDLIIWDGGHASSLKLDVSNASLLACALTQWADGAEKPYVHTCAPCLAKTLDESVGVIVDARRACRAATCKDPEAVDDMRDVADALGILEES